MKATIREQATKKPNFYLPMISLTNLLLDVPARLVTFCLRFCQCNPLQNLSSPFYRICDNPQFSVAPGVIHPHQGQVAKSLPLNVCSGIITYRFEIIFTSSLNLKMFFETRSRARPRDIVQLKPAYKKRLVV